MTDEKTYFKHLAGIAAFLGWCRRWSQMPNGLSISNQVASLGPVAVQRFGVAWPRKKRFGDRPSLLYQSTEGQWIENIQWARAILERGEEHYSLLLVSRLVLGDESKFMNLPVFALRIPIAREQGGLWAELAPQTLPLRLLWVEEGDAHVATAVVDLPLSMITQGDPVFLPYETAEGLSFHEMLERRLLQTGVEFNPGFQGSGTVHVEDPYLQAQLAYRQGLKSGADIANS